MTTVSEEEKRDQSRKQESRSRQNTEPKAYNIHSIITYLMLWMAAWIDTSAISKIEGLCFTSDSHLCAYVFPLNREGVLS